MAVDNCIHDMARTCLGRGWAGHAGLAVEQRATGAQAG